MSSTHSPAGASSVWTIHPQEYLDSHQASFLAFHSDYPDGKQGGIEIIQHGERLATCGYLRVAGTGIGHASPKLKSRTVRREGAGTPSLEVVASVPGTEITYVTRLEPDGDAIRLSIHVDKPLSAWGVSSAHFDMSLYPPALWGKTYTCGNAGGVFARSFGAAITQNASGATSSPPLAAGPAITLAAEDPLLNIVFRALDGDISLADDRWRYIAAWFDLRSQVPVDRAGQLMSWLITPSRIAGWRKPPMIGVSQIGYHPGQEKRAIIELDPQWNVNDASSGPATLLRVDQARGLELVRSAQPKEWGMWLHDHYAVFDFSDVRDEGVYFVRYGASQAGPFRIAQDVYANGVWQPTLLDYFPVQMCHVRVTEGGRVWHDACHVDDAMQVSWPFNYVDGYVQHATSDTPFQPYQHIPHLDQGGWHDAGDTDLAAGSQAGTTYWLALAREQFGVNVDATTVESDKRLITMHRPDGVPDIVQQVEHGVENLLGGYRACGHSFCGIIESTPQMYHEYGDLAGMTDNRVYDPSLPENAVEGNRSGRKDDRFAFTNRDTALEYMVGAALAASSRVLRGFRNDLADECLKTARAIWDFEHAQAQPAVSKNTYVPRDRDAMEIRLAVELLLSTGDAAYRDALRKLWPNVLKDPGQAAWPVMRVLDQVADADMKQTLRGALATWASTLHEQLATNPFGVQWRKQTWGIGWNIQDLACRYYYCLKAFPDLFQANRLFDVVHWVLGCHSGGNNYSFVSGVGTNSLTAAFGVNRADWSFIAGGVASGTALIGSDVWELKTNFPWLWQQSEYVMSGAATWIFLVLAVEKLLNG